MKMYIGKNIKEQRELSQMTQAELADKLGVSNKLVWSWESNRTEPKAAHVQKMCEVFGCSEDELIKQINIDICYDEYMLLEQYRSTTPTKRAEIQRYIAYMTKIMEMKNEKSE